MFNRMYNTAAGTVSIDFRDSGKITGLTVTMNNAAAGVNNWELSFNSAPQYATNDTTGTVATGQVATGGQFTQHFGPLDIPVEVGERFYLHQSAAGYANCVVHTDLPTVKASTRRR